MNRPTTAERVVSVEEWRSNTSTWNRRGKFPTEVIQGIAFALLNDRKNDSIYTALNDILSCMLVSKEFYMAVLPVYYTHVPISHSLQFITFLTHLQQYPYLGPLVKCLDFSGFSSVGLGRTARRNSQVEHLTGNTLTECLTLTYNLQEFLINTHVQDDISESVLKQLYSLPKLEALDFCGCVSTGFVQTVTKVDFSRLTRIKRVSFHECYSLPSNFFTSFLAKLDELTHLEVSGTKFSSDALFNISQKARLDQLGLAKCMNVKEGDLITFLASHPAASQLTYLNILSPLSSSRALTAESLDHILPLLPRTLKHLNLFGASLEKRHVPLLPDGLDELNIGGSKIFFSDLMPFIAETSCYYVGLANIRGINAYEITEGIQRMSENLKVIEISPLLQNGLKTYLEWQVVPGRGQRVWYVRADEVRDCDGYPRWCPFKIDCCASLEKMRGIYYYYSFAHI